MDESRLKFISLGTRGSDLALAQARQVSWLIQRENVELSINIKPIATAGDKILDSPLSQIGDKGLFVKEIENELLASEIDIAVHSCKDLPTELPEGLIIAAFDTREDPRDVFIGKAGNIDEIPRGARIGTSSLRRRSQLLSLRPDLDIVDIRGNVDTRITKIEEGEMFGTVLAAAGVKRLKREGEIAFFFAEDEIVPAVGQGVIAIECRERDNLVQNILAAINDGSSSAAVTAERALMHELQGGCQVPIGAHGTVQNEILKLDAYIGSLDGQKSVRDSVEGAVDNAAETGIELARKMKASGGDAILQEVRAQAE
jgi:hydroxymethylbilane synthase